MAELTTKELSVEQSTCACGCCGPVQTREAAPEVQETRADAICDCGCTGSGCACGCACCG